MVSRFKFVLPVILLIGFLTGPVSVFSQVIDARTTNVALDDESGFKHIVSFQPLVFLSGISSANVPIPLRYELKLPKTMILLSFYDGLFFSSVDQLGVTVYNELRIGPKINLMGDKLDGLFIRPLFDFGYGTIPYAWKSTDAKSIMTTMMYGASLDIGYTIVLDIGFVIEAYLGGYYHWSMVQDVKLADRYEPYLGIGVGWSF